MMKRTLFVSFSLFLLCSAFSVTAQEDNSWFTRRQPSRPMPPPPEEPPAVPLDGGLIGLIAAGGALGYKRYKEKKTSD